MNQSINNARSRIAALAILASALLPAAQLLAYTKHTTIWDHGDDSGLKFVESREILSRTSQKTIDEVRNTTGNVMEFTKKKVKRKSFKETSTLKKLKEESHSSKFSVQSNVEVQYGAAKGGMQTAAEFESAVKTYMESTDLHESQESQEESTDVVVRLNPGDRFVLYRNTTIVDGFTDEYDTTEKLLTLEEQKLVLKVTINLKPGFSMFLDKIVECNRGISTDKGEWNTYAEIASACQVEGGLKRYVDMVLSTLWENAEDTYSWHLVIEAAKRADERLAKGDNRAAFGYILAGFNGIQNPSHNDWAWNALKQINTAYIASAR